MSVTLIFRPRPDWHAEPLPHVELPAKKRTYNPPTQDLLDRVRKHAFSMLESDNEKYASKHLSASSSHRFLSTIVSSGTISDKVSALTLVVQESPLHNIKAFESLIGLARKRSRGQAVSALGALKDLLAQGVVLPSERKLKTFQSQPGLIAAFQNRETWRNDEALPGGIQDIHLVSWAYEDWLKTSYFEILKILESWCNDEVEYARARAVSYVWELLKEKPEQEANLLRLLINKLGDPNKKIASKASFLLLQLQTTHPLMKPIIISSIESDLLFRPGQSSHARYYAIITLNQVVLSRQEVEVADKLLEIYFGLFVSLLKKPKIEVASELQVNKKGEKQGGGGQKGKKAKEKANGKEKQTQTEEDLKEKMISAVLTGVNRAFPFSQASDSTFEPHLDTLFKITHSSNFNTSIQALMFIQQLTSLKQMSMDRFYRTLYESLLDPRLINSSKQTMYLNLLFRSLRSDLNVKRVKGFVKRLVQIVSLHQPPFICGVLFLIMELQKTFPSIKSLLNQPEALDDSDEEVFVDAPDDAVIVKSQPSKPGSGSVRKSTGAKASQAYDGRKRDADHSNADKSCLWELTPFLAHFHPSVSLFATRLLNDEALPGKPDLNLHTLTHFLDRFVYRNARSKPEGPRGVSIMQPLAGGDTSALLVTSKQTNKNQKPLNSDSFWRMRGEDVAVDEVFFHKYFNQVGKDQRPRAKSKTNVADDQASENDGMGDEQENEIWRALVGSRPELEGSEEGDSDLELEDLESEEDDSAVDIEVDAEEEEVLHEGQDSFEPSDPEEAGDLDFVKEEDGQYASDDEIPSDLGEAFEADLELSKEAKDDDRSKKKKRRKLKHLPTFASADEYVALLREEDEGMY